MTNKTLNAALKRSQRDALTQVEIDWPDSRGLLERLALGLEEQHPADAAALALRLQRLVLTATTAHKEAKKAGVPDRERFAAFFEGILGALVACEHPILAQALTADQRRVLAGRIRVVPTAPRRGLEAEAGPRDA